MMFVSRFLIRFVGKTSPTKYSETFIHNIKMSSPANCIHNIKAHQPAFIDDFKFTKRAAVLIPLFIDSNGILSVMLTLRSKFLRTHAGEVAFPGGKQDLEDPSLVFTALREAQEEIGLAPTDVQVLKVLSPALSKNNILVTPVIGLIPSTFEPVTFPNVRSLILLKFLQFSLFH